MKQTKIYKKKIKKLIKDLILSILNYMFVEKIESLKLEIDNEMFVLLKSNKSIITTDDFEFFLNELDIEQLMIILSKLEKNEYEKIN